jgi:hypothetical protein
MNHRRQPVICLLRLAAGLLFCAGGVALSVPAAAQVSLMGRVVLNFTATPNRVPADGKTRSHIRIDLRNPDGTPFADGTPAVLHTDFGFFTTTGADRQSTVNLLSRGGQLTADLLSATAGTAEITITCLNSRLTGLVDFLCPGETALADTRIVHIGGKWMGYALDQNMVEARDHASARFGHTSLEGADLLQLDVAQMILRGGPGVLTSGKIKLEGADFYLDLPRKRGVLQRIGASGVERLTFDLVTLQVRTMDWVIPDDAFTRNTASSGTWILGKEITVFSGDKIVFHHGGLYTETSKVISLPPIWILALPGYSGISSTQVLGVSSDGGLAVNYPYFIAAGDCSTDAIALQKGAAATTVIGPDEWGQGLEHEYRTGQTQGLISLAGLPRSDWGAQWSDTRALAGGQTSSLNLSSPDHRSLYWDGSLYDYHPGYSVNYRTSFSASEEAPTDWSGVVEWLSDTRPCGRSRLSPSYSLGTSAGVQQGGLELNPNPQFVQEFLGTLYWRPLALSRNTSLTPTLTNVFTWDTSPFEGNNLNGQLRLDNSVPNKYDLDLLYSASYLSGDLTQIEVPAQGGSGTQIALVAQPALQQILTTDLRLYHGKKWMIYLTGEKDLDTSDWYSLATWDYYLSSQWRVELMGNWYRQAGVNYSDRSIYLGRTFWQGREVGLSWSAQTGHLSVELTGLATTF